MMEEQKTVNLNTRDEHLDSLRGIGALSIVFIHSIYYGYASYIFPQWLMSLVLLVDVPFFFYLSGWSARYIKGMSKVLNGIFKIWGQWILFLIVIFSWCVSIWNFNPYANFAEFARNCLFLNTELIYSFPVIGTSVWFIPIYVQVSIIGFGIILFTKQKWVGYNDVFIILLILFCYGTLSETLSYNSILVLFYLLFYLFGYRSQEWKIKHFFTMTLLITLCIGMTILGSMLAGKDFTNMQSCKFPPSIPYMAFSMISVTIALWIKSKNMHPKILQHIGRNAIFYYFAQGATASTIPIVYFEKWLSDNPNILQIIGYIIIGELCTIAFAEFLSVLYHVANRCFARIARCLQVIFRNWFERIGNYEET